jgi:hypothetical protein
MRLITCGDIALICVFSRSAIALPRCDGAASPAGQNNNILFTDYLKFGDRYITISLFMSAGNANEPGLFPHFSLPACIFFPKTVKTRI